MQSPLPTQLNAIRSGKGDAVVFLHPIGLTHRFWTDVIDAMGDGVSAYALDLPGHGDSTVGDGPLSIESMAVDLAEALKAIDVGPAIVVGCSFGGMIAQALAAHAPTLVRGLVLANTNFTQTDAGRAAMRDRARLARTGMENVVEPWLKRWFSPEVHAANPTGAAQIEAMLLDADTETHAQCWEAIGDLDLTAQLPRITVQALVVAGGDDRSIPMEKSQALAAGLPHADLKVFAGAGHLTPFERPQEFADLVLNFARSLQAE